MKIAEEQIQVTYIFDYTRIGSQNFNIFESTK